MYLCTIHQMSHEQFVFIATISTIIQNPQPCRTLQYWLISWIQLYSEQKSTQKHFHRHDPNTSHKYSKIITIIVCLSEHEWRLPGASVRSQWECSLTLRLTTVFVLLHLWMWFLRICIRSLYNKYYEQVMYNINWTCFSLQKKYGSKYYNNNFNGPLSVFQVSETTM